MNVSMEKVSPASAVITVKMEKADYEQEVTKSLKTFCKKAQIKGFREGHVPFGMAKKLYGAQAKYEEVNKILSSKLFGYIEDEKIMILGEPLAHEGQEPQDIENQDEFTFQFDVALRPEINIDMTDKDTVDYYDIKVDDEEVKSWTEQVTRQHGHPVNVDAYAEGDILRGLLAELDGDGQPLEGGIQIEKASLMPNYFKTDDQKKLFETAKTNDVITFNPSEAYKGSDTEVAALLKIDKEQVGSHTGNFSFQVDEISRFTPAELNQELFDSIFGKDTVKTEDEFKTKVKETLEGQHVVDSDYKFLLDLRAYAEKKAGDVEFANDLLKRLMLQANKDKDEKYVDEHFDNSIKELKWQIIKDELAKKQGIKVEQEEIKETAKQMARAQFAQYGMYDIPEEYVEQYAQGMLGKREQVNNLIEECVQKKLVAALKNVVKLNRKSVSTKEFQTLFEEK